MHTSAWPTTILAMLLLAACSQEAPPEAAKGPVAAGEKQVAASPAAPEPQAASDEGAEEEEGDAGPPTTEKEMYGYQFEVMPFPPPLGPNGEKRTFEADSTAARGFTGDVTFSALPIPENSDSPTHPVRMQGANGLSYDLRMVENGGVDAISTIDWSKIMMIPVGMADFLKASAKSDKPVKTEDLADPGTLVFVFEIIKTGKSGKPSDAPGCGNDRYVAITAPSDKNWDDTPLVIATFSPGPWPPADSSRNCSAAIYAPGTTVP